MYYTYIVFYSNIIYKRTYYNLLLLLFLKVVLRNIIELSNLKILICSGIYIYFLHSYYIGS